MFPNLTALVLGILVCFIAPAILINVAVPFETSKRILHQDKWGIGFVVAGMVLVAIGYIWFAEYLMGIGGLGIFSMGLGVLIMLPDGPTEWLMDKRIPPILVGIYGLYLFLKSLFSPLIEPFLKFTDELYDVLAATFKVVQSLFGIFVDSVPWSQMAPALYGIAAMLFALAYLTIYSRYFKK